ncbi:MAG TPA: glycine betaine ABC transporter substrate-binding protein [Gemmataceae bacterium]|nr:glycine betaine ABC transporter substrate-binding protein [Gemmataceae bacterium]
MRTRARLIVVLAACLTTGSATTSVSAEPSAVRTGSKAFPESVILGEMLTLLAEHSGATTEYRKGLSGTQVAWRALEKGEIDGYIEYAGTIRKEILTGLDLPTADDVRRALAEHGVSMSRPLGFNNAYALGMKRDVAEQRSVRAISDLRAHPELRFGFTTEFLDRGDGWPGLRARYQLPQTNVRGMEHALAYTSLQDGSIDVMDLYSTDAKIKRFDLVALADDQHYFPNYDAVLLYRNDLQTRAPQVMAAWLKLEGRINEDQMIALNAAVELENLPERRVAADYLAKSGLLSAEEARRVEVEGLTARLARAAREHVALVLLSLAAAIVVALPLGILAAFRPALGQIVLAVAGILQTIPSIAILGLMIPLLGIGFRPAMVALFLYSLLPIIRNTHAGLRNIPLSLRESAEALGLPASARLRLIELPLASPTILAGIKIAAVINVGTATLGGFIGAGGFGEVIFTGLYKSDRALILQGAIPTALLALLVQGLFELAERFLVPKGLRLQRQR